MTIFVVVSGLRSKNLREQEPLWLVMISVILDCTLYRNNLYIKALNQWLIPTNSSIKDRLVKSVHNSLFLNQSILNQSWTETNRGHVIFRLQCEVPTIIILYRKHFIYQLIHLQIGITRLTVQLKHVLNVLKSWVECRSLIRRRYYIVHIIRLRCVQGACHCTQRSRIARQPHTQALVRT